MNLLLLGGTSFIGRELARVLQDAGHAVTVFNRGRTTDDLGPGIERLRGDRDDAASLQVLAGRRWDACVDVSGYTPQQVGASVALLREQVARYVFVSAVSVYGSPTHGPLDEDHPRMPPLHAHDSVIDAGSYGPLKVACEDIVSVAFGARATVLRPQVVVGPRDDRRRLQWWLQRAARGGPMLAPGDGDDAVQFIDVRDVAGFACTVLEHGLAGAFNLAGPRLGWAALLRAIGAHDLHWVPAVRLAAAGLTFLELPLYRERGSPRSGLMHVSAARAESMGLRLTPLTDTLSSLRSNLARHGAVPGLASEREAALIAQAGRTPP